DPVTLPALIEVARGRRRVELGSSARGRMDRSRAAVERVGAGGSDAPRVYGVNTGFGALAEVGIGADSIRDLPKNLVRSPAAGLAPVAFEAKEGISLDNGTQLMTAVGALAVADAIDLARVADVAGVMSLETIKGSRRPFDPRVAATRPHPGAVISAANLWRL